MNWTSSSSFKLNSEAALTRLHSYLRVHSVVNSKLYSKRKEVLDFFSKMFWNSRFFNFFQSWLFLLSVLMGQFSRCLFERYSWFVIKGVMKVQTYTRGVSQQLIKWHDIFCVYFDFCLDWMSESDNLSNGPLQRD